MVEKETANKPFQQTATPASYRLSVLPFKHEENIYLDYEREQLIPEKLSAEGPAFLVEDFNGDQQKDLFVGGGDINLPAFTYPTEKEAII